MMASSANIPPHKIVLCVAYPYEKADFVRCLQRGNSDFIASMNLSHLSLEEAWQQYDIDTATGIRHCIEELKSRNVDVIPLYDANDMSSAVGYDVVIILAHHVETDDSIELLNGPVPTSIFAASFIWVKDCIIDISSCFSMTFRQLQECFFPACQILEINAEPSFSLRLLLIQETIERLAHDSSRGYVDTLLDVYVDSLKMPKEDVFRQDHTHKSYFNTVFDALVYIGEYIYANLNAFNNDLREKILHNYVLRYLPSTGGFAYVPNFCNNTQEIDVRDLVLCGFAGPSNAEKDLSDMPCKEQDDWSDEPCKAENKWFDGSSYFDIDWYEDPNISNDNHFPHSVVENDGFEEPRIVKKDLPDGTNDSEVNQVIESLRSSVYAPSEANPGDSFMAQLYIHRMEDSPLIQITATSVDMTSGLRNRKCLSFPLNSGDAIKARLEALFDKRKEFEIDESEKEAIWNGEPVSLDYVVNVKEECIAKAFRGRLRICVNSQPVGDILFNVFINNDISAHSQTRNDNFDIVPFDKRQEANEALKMVKGKLEEQISALEKYSNNDGQCTLANVNQELAISRLCLNLIKNGCSKTSPVKVVFISSTSDLKEYRDRVRKAIADCQMYPEMYEHWNQGDIYPRDKCCEKVMSSDIFICILGANYGRIEPMSGISMTEMEYRVAQLSGKPILVYIDDHYLSKMKLLKDEQLKQKQLSLINEIKEKRWVQFFDSPDSLEKLVRAELSDVKKTLV